MQSCRGREDCASRIDERVCGPAGSQHWPRIKVRAHHLPDAGVVCQPGWPGARKISAAALAGGRGVRWHQQDRVPLIDELIGLGGGIGHDKEKTASEPQEGFNREGRRQ